MEDIRITYNEALLYLAIWNGVLGVLFGFFPLLVGLKLRNRKYGAFGLAGSIVGGAIAGVLLSFPVAIIFTWLILRSSAVAAVPVAADVQNSTQPDNSGER